MEINEVRLKEIIVVGGGGFAKEVIWLAEDCGYKVVGVLDDDQSMRGKKVLGIDVLGSVSQWHKYAQYEFVLAIGSPKTRHLVFNKMIVGGQVNFTTLIHPNVIISNHVTIGAGCIICAGCILTVDIKLGQHCILNLNSTVGHDSIFGDFVTIAPIVAISGNVNLGDYTEIGTGSSIRQGVKVHKGAMLGMGGVLTKDIPENAIFVGNPARELKK